MFAAGLVSTIDGTSYGLPPEVARARSTPLTVMRTAAIRALARATPAMEERVRRARIEDISNLPLAG